MRRLRLWLSPWTWIKVWASLLALVINGVQLSEVSDHDGTWLRGQNRNWHERASLVAFEGRQIRKHLGFLDE